MNIVKIETTNGVHYAIRRIFLFRRTYLDLIDADRDAWHSRNSLYFRHCLSDDLKFIVTRYNVLSRPETVLNLTEIEKLILGE